jgi:hypothetical protein
MMYLYTLSMVQPASLVGIPKVRTIEADFMVIDSGHFVFGENYKGPFATVAVSQVLQLDVEPNPYHQETEPKDNTAPGERDVTR